MPEIPRNNLNPEEEHDLDRDVSRGEEQGSESLDSLSDGVLRTHEHPEAQDHVSSDQHDTHELRNGVFAKSTEPEPKAPEEEPVSWWEKLKHSALHGNKQKAEAAKTSSRSSRRQNKTGLLVGGVVGVVALAAWLFSVVSAPVRKPPIQETAAAQQQPPASTQKSLTPGLDAHPAEQSASGDNSITPADIRATSNGVPAAGKTTPPKQSTAVNDEQDYALGKIPPPPAAPMIAPAPPPAAPAAAQKNPLDTTALVFVRRVVKDSNTGARIDPVSFQPVIALKSQEFDSLTTGTRLVARLETPVSTAVSLPAVATVEYNYEDKDHTLLIPAGSRVFGTLEQADAQGFVGLHFVSIQRPSDPGPIPFEARAIGLDYKPLKGTVTGRNRGRRFLVRAGTGIGQMTAATVGMSRGTGAGDALNSNVLVREQLMNNIGSAGDQEIQQMAYSEHTVVTLVGNTRFYLVVDHEPKSRDNRESREQRAAESNANAAGVQAQLLELRKELADITAKQTPLASQGVSTAEPVTTSDAAAAPQ